ncbi:MAG: hypothetical protein QGG25_15690 [Phycisphaerae bacterium]|jgi:hypothetical protein|nr:hypothetical protein [Phycisphaerae bacterium]
MKRTEILICGLILAFISTAAMAQVAAAPEPEPAAPAAVAPESLEAIEAKIKALKAQEDQAEDKLEEIHTKISQSAAVADLKKAASAADKVYQEKKVSDPTIIAAKKTSGDASDALKAVVLGKVKASDAGAAILKEISDLEEKRADLSVQGAIAELKLEHKDSRVSRTLAADSVLKEYYRAYQSAEKGDARDQARKNYYKVKTAALEKMPQAKELMDEIKTCEKGMDETENAIDAAEDKLDKLYDAAAESDDEDIVAAKAKREATRKAYQQAYYGGEMQAARDARSAAKKALSDKVRALAAEDPQAAPLRVELDALDKKIDELKSKARKLQKKSSK